MPRDGTPRRVCCKQQPAASEPVARGSAAGFSFGNARLHGCPAQLFDRLQGCVHQVDLGQHLEVDLRGIFRQNQIFVSLKRIRLRFEAASQSINCMVSMEIMFGINLMHWEKRKKKNSHRVVCQEQRLHSGMPARRS